MQGFATVWLVAVTCLAAACHAVTEQTGASTSVAVNISSLTPRGFGWVADGDGKDGAAAVLERYSLVPHLRIEPSKPSMPLPLGTVDKCAKECDDNGKACGGFSFSASERSCILQHEGFSYDSGYEYLEKTGGGSSALVAAAEITLGRAKASHLENTHNLEDAQDAALKEQARCDRIEHDQELLQLQTLKLSIAYHDARDGVAAAKEGVATTDERFAAAEVSYKEARVAAAQLWQRVLDKRKGVTHLQNTSRNASHELNLLLTRPHYRISNETIANELLAQLVNSSHLSQAAEHSAAYLSDHTDRQAEHGKLVQTELDTVNSTSFSLLSEHSEERKQVAEVKAQFSKITELFRALQHSTSLQLDVQRTLRQAQANLTKASEAVDFVMRQFVGSNLDMSLCAERLSSAGLKVELASATQQLTKARFDQAESEMNIALGGQREEEGQQHRAAMKARINMLTAKATPLTGFTLKYMGWPLDNMRLQTANERFPNPAVVGSDEGILELHDCADRCLRNQLCKGFFRRNDGTCFLVNEKSVVTHTNVTGVSYLKSAAARALKHSCQTRATPACKCANFMDHRPRWELNQACCAQPDESPKIHPWCFCDQNADNGGNSAPIPEWRYCVAEPVCQQQATAKCTCAKWEIRKPQYGLEGRCCSQPDADRRQAPWCFCQRDQPGAPETAKCEKEFEPKAKSLFNPVTYFRKVPGLARSGTKVEQLSDVTNTKECADHCLLMVACRALQYSVETKECTLLNKALPYSTEYDYYEHPPSNNPEQARSQKKKSARLWALGASRADQENEGHLSCVLAESSFVKQHEKLTFSRRAHNLAVAHATGAAETFRKHEAAMAALRARIADLTMARAAARIQLHDNKQSRELLSAQVQKLERKLAQRVRRQARLQMQMKLFGDMMRDAVDDNDYDIAIRRGELTNSSLKVAVKETAARTAALKQPAADLRSSIQAVNKSIQDVQNNTDQIELECQPKHARMAVLLRGLRSRWQALRTKRKERKGELNQAEAEWRKAMQLKERSRRVCDAKRLADSTKSTDQLTAERNSWRAYKKEVAASKWLARAAKRAKKAANKKEVKLLEKHMVQQVAALEKRADSIQTNVVEAYRDTAKELGQRIAAVKGECQAEDEREKQLQQLEASAQEKFDKKSADLEVAVLSHDAASAGALSVEVSESRLELWELRSERKRRQISSWRLSTLLGELKQKEAVMKHHTMKQDNMRAISKANSAIAKATEEEERVDQSLSDSEKETQARVHEAHSQAEAAAQRVGEAQIALKKVETAIADAKAKLKASNKGLALKKMAKIKSDQQKTVQMKRDIKQLTLDLREARKAQAKRVIQLKKDLGKHKKEQKLAARAQLKQAAARSSVARLALPAETAMLSQVTATTAQFVKARTQSLDTFTTEVEAAVQEYQQSEQETDQLAEAVTQAKDDLKRRTRDEEALFQTQPFKPAAEQAEALADKAAKVKAAHIGLTRLEEEHSLATSKTRALQGQLLFTVDGIVKRSLLAAEGEAALMQPDNSTSMNWVIHSQPNSTAAKKQRQVTALRRQTLQVQRQAAAVLHNATKTAKVRDAVADHQIETYSAALQKAKAQKVRAGIDGEARKSSAESRADQVVEQAEDQAQQLLSAALGTNSSLAQTSKAAANCKILVSDCHQNGTSAVHFPHLFSQPGLFTGEEQPACLARAQELHSRCGGNSAALNQVMHKILLRFDPSLDLKSENVSQAYQLGQLQQDSDTEHLDLDE